VSARLADPGFCRCASSSAMFLVLALKWKSNMSPRKGTTPTQLSMAWLTAMRATSRFGRW
jgi:hypothetical protein